MARSGSLAATSKQPTTSPRRPLMSQMKTFPCPVASNEQERKLGYRGGLLLMLALYSNPKWFSTVRGAVERLTETLGFPIAQGRSITRAVDEALTNIVRHSYRNRLDQPIAMYFRRAQRRHDGQVQQGLEILLCDRGPAVDPSKFQGRDRGHKAGFRAPAELAHRVDAALFESTWRWVGQGDCCKNGGRC